MKPRCGGLHPTSRQGYSTRAGQPPCNLNLLSQRKVIFLRLGNTCKVTSSILNIQNTQTLGLILRGNHVHSQFPNPLQPSPALRNPTSRAQTRAMGQRNSHPRQHLLLPRLARRVPKRLTKQPRRTPVQSLLRRKRLPHGAPSRVGILVRRL